MQLSEFGENWEHCSSCERVLNANMLGGWEWVFAFIASIMFICRIKFLLVYFVYTLVFSGQEVITFDLLEDQAKYQA